MGKMLIIKAEDKYTEFNLTQKSRINLYGVISKSFNCDEGYLKLEEVSMAHKDGTIEEVYMVYNHLCLTPVNITASQIVGRLIYGDVVFISKNNLSFE